MSIRLKKTTKYLMVIEHFNKLQVNKSKGVHTNFNSRKNLDQVERFE